jgi:ubiquinone/menaquinone biosynthesis C-methylase UbiE
VSAAIFDHLAPSYDAMWTDAPIGRHQRDAVWRRIDPLFHAGDRVLDLGCGTGHDALHLTSLGIDVQAFDASAGMVRIARAKGVNARQLPLEELRTLCGTFDGAISNFGALNCVTGYEATASVLGRLIRPGGKLAICLAGPVCAWEIGHFLIRGQAVKAFRRLSAADYKGIPVTYPSLAKLAHAFSGDFALINCYGIGLCVPPSYVGGLHESTIAQLALIDRHIAHWPVLRCMADHRLLIFKRL